MGKVDEGGVCISRWRSERRDGAEFVNNNNNNNDNNDNNDNIK